MQRHYLIDFDSTFVRVEALDELAKIALADNVERDKVAAKIADITRRCMEGELAFDESLKQRLALFRPTVAHIEELVTLLRQSVTASFERNKEFLRQYADSIYIVSGGFQEYIRPVVEQFGIRSYHVLANSFVLDGDGEVVGYDTANPLSRDGGKVAAVRALALDGEVVMIGDGYSDYQLKEAGLVKTFYAFTENVDRPAVAAKADHVLANLDDFLLINNASLV